MAFVPSIEFISAQAQRGKEWAKGAAREALTETEKLEIPWKEVTFVAGAFAIAAALAWAESAQGEEQLNRANFKTLSSGSDLPALPNLESFTP